MINTSPFAALKRRTIAGKTMAYIDEGEGDATPSSFNTVTAPRPTCGAT